MHSDKAISEQSITWYVSFISIYPLHHLLIEALVWGAVRKNIISDGFSTKTAISTHI